jgi:hypothetical protein
VATFAAIATGVAQAIPGGRFTAAQFRDRAGVGRTLAIHVLESLDRLAITQRIADVRLIRQDFAPILGAAETVAPAPRKAPSPSPRKPAPSAGVSRAPSRAPSYRRSHPR